MGNVQNERAAGIADTVQRGLGMLPQQAICEDCTEGEIEKMSEQGPVYTACQFVIPSKIPLILFRKTILNTL